MGRPRFVYIDYTNEVAATPVQAFAFLEDIERWPQWIRRIPSARNPDSAPWRVGHAIEFKPDFAPAALKMHVFHHEPGRTLGWGLGRPGSALGSIEHRFDFEPAGTERCRIRHREIAEGPLALLTWPMQPLVHKFNKDWARDFERAFGG